MSGKPPGEDLFLEVADHHVWGATDMDGREPDVVLLVKVWFYSIKCSFCHWIGKIRKGFFSSNLPFVDYVHLIWGCKCVWATLANVMNIF